MSLTYLERDCLTFIIDYIHEHKGVGPSYEEIKEALGQSSKSVVHRVVRGLVVKRYVEKPKGAKRDFRILKNTDGATYTGAKLNFKHWINYDRRQFAQKMRVEAVTYRGWTAEAALKHMADRLEGRA